MKIPIYNSKEELGAPKTYPIKREVVQENKWASAVKGSIGLLEQRHNEIELERDQMEVTKAMSALGDAERLMIADEEARPVGDAPETLNRGGDWYKKNIKSIGGGLRSKTSREMFTMKAEVKRNNGLNRLAGHMANQHKVQQKHDLQGLEANIYSDINVGIDANQLDERIKELNEKITGFYKGANADAVKLNTKTGLIHAFLKDAAISSPEKIPGLLKRYDKDLSEQDAKAITDIAERTLNATEASGIYDEIKSKYKGDPAGALAASYDMQLTDAPPGIVNAVRNMLKDEFATFGHFKQADAKAVQTKAEVGAINFWVKGDYVSLRRHVLTQMNDTGRVEHWLEKINKVEDSALKGKDSPYEKSDPGVKAQITETIMTAPHTMDQSVIWSLNGSGLSTNDCTTLATMWEERSVKGSNPKEVEVANILKWYRQNNQFNSDVLENQQIHDRLLTDCFAWSAANPEGDVVDYMKQKLNALEGDMWLNRKMRGVMQMFSGVPGIEERPVNPILPGDLEEMVGWGEQSPSISKVTQEFPSHKVRRLVDEALGKYNKEK